MLCFCTVHEWYYVFVQGELLLANLGWLIGVLAWLIYVLLRAKGVICASIPLWPTMMSREIEKLPENTKRYILAGCNSYLSLCRCSLYTEAIDFNNSFCLFMI